MHREHGIPLARAHVVSWDTSKWFVSSEGSRISQRLVETGGGITATAVGEDQTQIRSYPQSFGDFRAGGWEIVESFDLLGNCDRIADEANALLTAPECPSDTRDLILGGSQVALQIHESVGHAIELDRILGWEAAFAGTSFLELDRLGELQYGSPLMRITADATIPGAMGTFGFDDEGTPATNTTIVDEGRWVGVLSGRDSAAVAGVAPGGMVRGEGFNRLPMVRMTNVGLLPGEDSLESIVADTDDGVHDADQPLLVDRRPSPQLPVRLRDRLGDQERQTGPHAAQPHLHGHHAGLLGARSTVWPAATTGGCGAHRTAARASRCRRCTPRTRRRRRASPVSASVCGGDAMTESTTSTATTSTTPAPPPTEDLVGLAGDVLERLQAQAGDGGYDAQVRATRQRHGLTRFANSFVHQHVDEDVTALDVRMARDGHAVGATTTDLTPEGIVDVRRDPARDGRQRTPGPGLGRLRASGRRRTPGGALRRGDRRQRPG